MLHRDRNSSRPRNNDWVWIASAGSLVYNNGQRTSCTIPLLILLSAGTARLRPQRRSASASPESLSFVTACPTLNRHSTSRDDVGSDPIHRVLPARNRMNAITTNACTNY